jgi:hypothetical protein
MNNTKVAVVFSEKKHHLWYINNHPGVIEAFKSLPKNFHVEFFCFTDVMNAYLTGNHVIWFKNTLKALKWGVNVYFEPNIVVCVGSPNYEWDKLLVGKYRKIFIYDSYEEPIKDYDWDLVIVPFQEDLRHFPKAMVGTVYNSRVFKPEEDISKTFKRCFPQQVTNIDLIKELTLTNNMVTMNKLSDVFYLSEIPSYMLASIINRSEAVCLLDRSNDIELALSSLACQTPVVTTDTNKSSLLPYVVTSAASAPIIEMAFDMAKVTLEDIDISQYTIESFVKRLKKVL